MKVALISPYEEITNLGARSLSAFIRRAGHQTRLIFSPIIANTGTGYSDPFKAETIDEILSLLEDVDLVGISVMSNHFEIATQITGEIHSKLGKKVVWGGIHPTARPEESLEHADIVCRGEGEEALLELVEKMENDVDPMETQNLWFRSNGDIRQNHSRPLIQDLDSLPLFDYSFKEHYYIDGSSSSTTLLTPENFQNYFQNIAGKIAYRTMTSRGCPHNCTYCCHSSLRTMYARQRYVRFRSPENIIGELMFVRDSMDYINFVIFMDEVFLLMSLEKIKEFSELYREKIDQPFRIQLSPPSISEEKLQLLVDSGCILVGMGIETGSARTQSLYNRKFGNNDKIIRGASIIHKFHKKVPFIVYDVIVDNPYESIEDTIETFKLLLKLPRPFQVNLFSLTFFPGTDLYKKAKEDGHIHKDTLEMYRKMISSVDRNYANTILKLVNLQSTPTFLLKPLGNKWIANLINRAPGKVLSLLEKTYLLIEKIFRFFLFRRKVITVYGLRSTQAE